VYERHFNQPLNPAIAFIAAIHAQAQLSAQIVALTIPSLLHDLHDLG